MYQQCGAPFVDSAPTFHLMDRRGCGSNDPAGPVFDPVHGVFHHFFQVHLARAAARGPVWGHFVSRDLVAWAQLPAALWNGIDLSSGVSAPSRMSQYDTDGVWTGSALVVDGAGPLRAGRGVVLLYPGLCDTAHWPSCRAKGTLLAHAVPADYETDPLLTVWQKPDYNPVLAPEHAPSDAGWADRDPCTPWRTSFGEWRFRTFDGRVYGAERDEDVVAGRWYAIGKCADFKEGECPSFYPLPGPTPGFEAEYSALAAQGRLPTHVHKLSWHEHDYWQLGTYAEGAPRTTGRFGATPGWDELAHFRPISPGGVYYASKDAEYPALGGGVRRVNWGWARVAPASVQSLPRQITFNPVTRGLEQAPLDELTNLRGEPLHLAAAGAVLKPGLPRLSPAPGLPQSEVLLEVALPAHAGAGAANLSLAFADATGEVLTCSVSLPARQAGTPRLRLFAARAACRLHCNLGGCTPHSPRGEVSEELRLASAETTLQLRVFTDHTLTEVFFQRGRVAITLGSTRLRGVDRLAMYAAGATIELERALVFPLRPIWTEPEAVAAAPRVFSAIVAEAPPPPPGVPWTEPPPSPAAPARDCLEPGALQEALADRRRHDPGRGEWCWTGLVTAESGFNAQLKEQCESRYIEPCCSELGDASQLAAGPLCVGGCALCAYERVGRAGDEYKCVMGPTKYFACMPPPPPLPPRPSPPPPPPPSPFPPPRPPPPPEPPERPELLDDEAPAGLFGDVRMGGPSTARVRAPATASGRDEATRTEPAHMPAALVLADGSNSGSALGWVFVSCFVLALVPLIFRLHSRLRDAYDEVVSTAAEDDDDDSESDASPDRRGDGVRATRPSASASNSACMRCATGPSMWSPAATNASPARLQTCTSLPTTADWD